MVVFFDVKGLMNDSSQKPSMLATFLGDLLRGGFIGAATWTRLLLR